MRALRNFKANRCCHLISRIANRAFFLTEVERMRFVERLWRVAEFSGIEVLTYCFMSNHFHLLVHALKLRSWMTRSCLTVSPRFTRGFVLPQSARNGPHVSGRTTSPARSSSARGSSAACTM
ncbi:MAG: transposase [Kiritimatiellia bacterium]